MICRNATDAERFALNDGVCGMKRVGRQLRFCSKSCREAGQHVAVCQGGTVFAVGTRPRRKGGS